MQDFVNNAALSSTKEGFMQELALSLPLLYCRPSTSTLTGSLSNFG